MCEMSAFMKKDSSCSGYKVKSTNCFNFYKV